jgi:peptide deformylase
MPILQTITAPDPILRQKSQPVASVTDEIRKLMNDMLETMYSDNGVGLSAIQVGVPKNVIVIDLQDDDDNSERAKDLYPLYMANTEIVERSSELNVAIEGCLSLPEQRVEVARSANIKVKFVDYNNNPKELKADGWLARVIQHEADHLDGKLLIDYLSTMKKDVALRKLNKIKKYIL